MARPAPAPLSRPPGQPAERARVLFLVILLATSTACNSVKARSPRLRNALRDRLEVFETVRPPTFPWAAVLVREGLVELAEKDPASAVTRLEDALRHQPHPEGLLALAEVSFRAGLEREALHPAESLPWFRDTAALATLALQNQGTTRPDLATNLHNQAVARLLRHAQHVAHREDQHWQCVLEQIGLALSSSTPDLAPARFSRLILADDVRVVGMDHVYRNDGLGVPIVAQRTVAGAASPDPLDRFHPRELKSAATAVVTLDSGIDERNWRRKPFSLKLFDAFLDRSVLIGDQAVTLAGDRTTPLALQVADGNLPNLEFTGLFDSEFRRKGIEAGLYMLRAYEPGKIPVILVHGLFSSPRAFVQTMNEMNNDPVISAKYQFWVFLYPTGQMIPASARQLRTSLNRVRQTLDPNHADAALDRMVLVGHSMGGLLSKMMVQDSGPTLWNAAFRRPITEFKAPPEVRETLEQSLIYEPVPFVRRVVFIATPHRGSPIADQFFGRTIARLIRRTSEQNRITDEIFRNNGPDLIAPEMKREPLNAIGNLRTDSPILRALDAIPIDPSVPYHSIIPQVAGTLPTDLVVEYRSSRMPGATSEKIVDGTHFSQQDPAVTAELKRILLAHLSRP